MALTGLFTKQLRASRNPTDSQVFEGDFLMLDYVATAGATVTYELAIPASADNPVILESVEHYVKTAFTSATTATIAVGDGTTADLYLATSAITPATAGSGATAAEGKNKLLTAAAKVVVTVSASDGVGGEGLLVLKLLHLKKA